MWPYLPTTPPAPIAVAVMLMHIILMAGLIAFLVAGMVDALVLAFKAMSLMKRKLLFPTIVLTIFLSMFSLGLNQPQLQLEN